MLPINREIIIKTTRITNSMYKVNSRAKSNSDLNEDIEWLY
jgi:hypothetical protein